MALDIFITDFTPHPDIPQAQNAFPDSENGQSPASPFGQYVLKVSVWDELADGDNSSLKAGKIVKMTNVRPWYREGVLEASMIGKYNSGCRLDRLRESDPEALELVKFVFGCFLPVAMLCC